MTTYKKKKLKDREGNYIVTPSSADIVYCQDGSTVEQKLNNIENDEFSPTITQVESMAKVGVGIDVDVSANVQDGYAKSAILKGNTKVNLIQESSSQDVILPYEFTEGQYVTINDTKESGAVGVELKGQTLVNLVESSQTITLSSNMSHPYGLIYKMKPLTTYTIFVTFSNNVATSNTALDIFLVQTLMSPNINISASEAKGVVKRKFTTLETVPESLIIGTRSSFQGTVDVDNIMILEGDYTNVDIPYFEGMQSVEAPSVTTVGKNLFDKELFKRNASKIPTYRINESVATWQNSGVSENYTLIDGVFKENTQYTFSLKTGLSNNVNLYIWYADNTKKWFNGNIVSVAGKTIRKITPVHSDGSYTTLDINDFQIEESSTATTYESYKSSTLTLPEEITLRGIGDVKDTLNTVTGEYTQRIGEVVLDGSESWSYNPTWSSGEYLASYMRFTYAKKSGLSNIISNKLKTTKQLSGGYITSEGIFGESNTSVVYLCISKNRILPSGSDNISDYRNAFKSYLQANPITVQYELATPITKKLSLTFTNQGNAPTTKLSTYNTTTHINASSQEGSLIPTLSHVNPSYPVILKPSTKYSIVADSYSNGHTNSPINFDLGGATVSTTVGTRVSTVTTPDTLTSEKLVMSGRGNMLNNVMVIEGDVVGDEVYFEGMCDVEMPVVTNCNMLDSESEDYKSNILSCNSEVVLRSLPNGVCDTLDLMTGEYVQRIGERVYQTGDENDTTVLTDKINTQYQLDTPITTTIDLVPSGTNPTTKPFVWKDGHIQLLSEQGTLTPSLEYSVITSRGGQILDNTRQIAKQDKRIYDLEMLLISSSISDAYQRLALQNSVQVMSYASYTEELTPSPIRYYMLSRLIEEGMYQESDMLDKLDTFFLYGEISLEQYYELVRLVVGETIMTLEEVGYTTSEYIEDFGKTYAMLMNKLEVSIQREEELSHYYDLANAYAQMNRLNPSEYEAIVGRIQNAYVSVLPEEVVDEVVEEVSDDSDITDEVVESATVNEIQTLEE